MRSSLQHNGFPVTEVFNFHDLYKIVEGIIPDDIIEKGNKEKSWDYGWNSEYDIIVISKDGTIGEIYFVYGLFIALPLAPALSKIDGFNKKKEDQRWEPKPIPKEIAHFRTMYGDDETSWRSADDEIVRIYEPYIKEEYRRRKEGHWFMNNGVPTYMTGDNYMFLQWSPIDIGHAEFRIPNLISYYHWEACKADNRCYGQNSIKNRREGWSHRAGSDLVSTITMSKNALGGVVSKTGDDAKSFFTEKVVPKSLNYPFFFKPLQDGSTDPKAELSYRSPPERITSKRKGVFSEDEGLNSKINWKNTKNNSYDSEKIKLIIEDESGKWLKPEVITTHWKRVKPTLRTGKKIVGKCKMGTTVNPKKEGGSAFLTLWNQSDTRNRMANGETISGLYQFFIPAEFNYEGFIDSYGFPVVLDPIEKTYGVDGEEIKIGSFRYFEEMSKSLEDDPDTLNDWLRENPRKVEHAFREPSASSPFLLSNIYDQIEYNEQMVKAVKGGGVVPRHETEYTRFNLIWRDGIKDSVVDAVAHPEGRFYATWIPSYEYQNKQIFVNGIKKPGNTDWGAFGVDPYDISQTTEAHRGSKGALTGFSRGKHMGGTEYGIFLEYEERPEDANEFFDDVIKCIVFYGMMILPERDRARLLYEMKERGYRGYVMNRPDKEDHELTGADKELGGYPGKNEQLRQDQILLMYNYSVNHLGISTNDIYREESTYPAMPFNRTLLSMAEFTPEKTTKSDLTMSLGAAMLAVQPKGFYAKQQKEIKVINIGLKRNKIVSHGT